MSTISHIPNLFLSLSFNRRLAIALGGVAVLTSLASQATAQAAGLAGQSKSFEEWYDLLDFVPEDASIDEIEQIFPEEHVGGAHQAYRDFIARHGQGYVGRRQVALYLTKTAVDGQVSQTEALPAIVVYVAKILIQAAARASAAIYSTLRLIVKGGVYYGRRGYSAFNLFLKNHQFLGGILIGVSANQVYDWLKRNMP